MLFDLHNDYLTATPAEQEELCLANAADEVSSIVLAVWATKLGLTADSYFDLIAKIPKVFGIKTYTAIEDIGAIRIDDYDGFLRKSVPMYVSLTWNGENEFAGGVGSEGGLTPKGKDLLAILKRNNIVVDVAHLNERSFLQVLGTYDGKIICSHTGARNAFDDMRNLSEVQLAALAERNALVGIFFAAKFLCGYNCDIWNVAHHIQKTAEIVGHENVGIGTDFCGAAVYPLGLSDYSGISKLYFSLQRCGFSDKDINKIFYKNAESFFGR